MAPLHNHFLTSKLVVVGTKKDVIFNQFFQLGIDKPSKKMKILILLDLFDNISAYMVMNIYFILIDPHMNLWITTGRDIDFCCVQHKITYEKLTYLLFRLENY